VRIGIVGLGHVDKKSDPEPCGGEVKETDEGQGSLSYRVAMRPLREGITGNSVDQQILAETVPVLPPIDQHALRWRDRRTLN